MTERQQAYLGCTPFPTDPLNHMLNMFVQKSIIGTCTLCGGQIYISSGGQEAMRDKTEYDWIPACIPCIPGSEDAQPGQMVPQIESQLRKLLGDDEVEQIKSDMPTLGDMKKVYPDAGTGTARPGANHPRSPGDLR